MYVIDTKSEKGKTEDRRATLPQTDLTPSLTTHVCGVSGTGVLSRDSLEPKGLRRTNPKKRAFPGKAITILSTLEPLFPGSYSVFILFTFYLFPTTTIPFFSLLTPLLTTMFPLFANPCAPAIGFKPITSPVLFSYLKLGILHCPTIFLYSSLLGFSVRLYGEVILVLAMRYCLVSPGYS